MENISNMANMANMTNMTNNMSLEDICISSIVYKIRGDKMNLKILNILPIILKYKILNGLNKFDKISHNNKFQKCMAQLEINLCYDCDIEVYYADYFNYNEIISLYLPYGGFKTVSIYNDNSYGHYFNLLKEENNWFYDYKSKVAMAIN